MRSNIFVCLAVIITSAAAYSQKTFTIKSKNLSFELPAAWSEGKKQEDKSRGVVVFPYNRQGIFDSKNREVVATIGIVCEEVPENLDPILYSSKYRHFEVKETFMHESGRMQIKYGLGFIGTYSYAGDEHTIAAVYAVNGKDGIQIILDITSELYPKVKDEFEAILRSIKLTKVHDANLSMQTRFVSVAELAFESYARKKDKSAEDAILKSGDSTYIFYVLARNATSLDDKLRYFRRFETSAPKVGLDLLYFERGNEFEDLKMADSALSDYNKLMAMHPNDASVYYLIGRMYSKIDSFKTAIEYMDKTLKLDKDWYLANFTRGSCLVELEKYDLAVKDLDVAIKKNEKDAMTWFLKGRAYYGKKDYKKAISLFENVKKLDSRSTEFIDGWIGSAKARMEEK